ncbi:MAG: cob(I)yrinic acid a,c-diamide adenosyltransferase [Thermoplasmata archaeon]|nr:MAG: cob(I)yrinic acid a,c-diamide adenosyltransferase [Aciduliprofundum sp.]HEU13109.1 cob(I)yrinic acid a,c-diamide adenosyltransferase [Euryarchaeota archaeon]
MHLKSGLVQVYTGNGKGKTTAAIGLAVRAAGNNLNVYIMHFMKSRRYGETKILKGIKNIKERYLGKPYFISKDPSIANKLKGVVVFEPGNPPRDYVELVRKGIKEVKGIIKSGKYDVVILDEIITALYFELVSMEDMKSILLERPKNVEIVLTGRYAPKELIDMADLVTEMVEVKHPYQRGIEARKGIEY